MAEETAGWKHTTVAKAGRVLVQVVESPNGKVGVSVSKFRRDKSGAERIYAGVFLPDPTEEEVTGIINGISDAYKRVKAMPKPAPAPVVLDIGKADLATLQGLITRLVGSGQLKLA